MGQRVVSNDPLLAPLVDEMLRKSVVELCPEPRFRARIFTVPKPDGRRRLILDVSPLNKAIVVRPFSLPSASDLRALLPQSAFMAKIDLTEAYWHIPIHPFFRRYLAFHFQGKDYQFRAMPFGLSVAPIAFTAVMRHPYRLLKERGHLALNYLDDWIVWASSFQACELAVQDLLSILGEIGFLVNKEKSHLVPTQSLDWLGIHWDTRMPSLSLPFSSAEKLTLKVKELSLASVASRRRIESLLGSMAFLGQWLPEAKWAFYRFLPALAHFPPSRDITVPFLPHLKVDLAWWLVAQNLTRPVALRPPKDSIWLWTDASDEGWGGHIGDGTSVWGQWSTSESTLHINLKEIRAVRLALVQLNPPSSRRIVVSVDNVTAAFALRSWGSRKSLSVLTEVRPLLDLCLSRNWWLEVLRIPSVSNVLADGLSRGYPLPSEWSLLPACRDHLFAWAGTPDVDLWATPFNRQLPVFVSPFLHPEASAVDALALNWNDWDFLYLFPPPALLEKSLLLLATFSGKGILIHSLSQSSPLWSLLEKRHLQSRPLLEPPGQFVRGVWVRDEWERSWQWTATLFSPPHSRPLSTHEWPGGSLMAGAQARDVRGK